MKAASPVTVDLYRLAYNAGRAVTFDELVDGMPSAYQNDANRWWVAREQAAGRDIPAEPWSASMLASVKREWVAEQVHSLVHTKRFSVNLKDGRPSRYKGRLGRDELVYSANKEQPPMVFEKVVVQRMVPWTPEIGGIGRRHMAGANFLAEVDRIAALGSKATKKDLEQAVELAKEALQYGPAS
ncbi:MAG TPA: hypothetical protein VLL25_11665 [Acidimicrobiales bacterium]|nr:hypothetical protein [Acidimicrobiales bacterium]